MSSALQHPAPLRDIESREDIERFVSTFYRKLLADDRLASIFTDVARVDLDKHLPLISDYWAKLLLGAADYRRHTMNIHRDLHVKRPLVAADFQRWLSHFFATIDSLYSGHNADRAKLIASRIAANMRSSLCGNAP